MHKSFYLIMLIVISFLEGCGTVAIKSTPPEAEVSILLPGKEDQKLLGKTPYNVDVGDLAEAAEDGSMVLMLSKEGYLPKYYVVPNLSGGDLKIEAILQPNLRSNYQKVNKIVALLFRAERMIKENRLDEAVKLADEVKGLNANIAAAYHITGTVLFLKKDINQSRFEWVRSLELDPQNNEARRMLTLIDKKLKKG